MTEEIHPTRYLIRGGRIYDHDGDIHQPATADLLIHGGIIEQIAPQIAADDGVEVLDAVGKLVVPGFVNAHRR
jgi:5-methylthioadenosine/S-adenosylhomocysteine deaminase